MISRFSEWVHAIAPRHIALAGLCGLSVVYLACFRYDLYGVEEGAARALLLNWSLGSHMLNPVAIMGFPDMRALLLAPLNFHWIGDLTAARTLAMFLTLATGLMLYSWAEKQLGDETALFASGLWLIAPLTISQAGSIGAGNFLVLAGILCYWSSGYYRASKHATPGNYFVLLLLIALAASMHPAGLGMAAALLWHETLIQRPARRKRVALYIGLGLMLFLILASRAGWPALSFFVNPLPALTTVLTGGSVADPSLGSGLLALGLLLIALLAGIRRSRDDLFSAMLLGGVMAGLVSANEAWAELALTYILFEGLRGLIQLNNRFGGNGLLRRRGMAIFLVMLLSTGFMIADKQYFLSNRTNQLHGVDNVIARLGEITAAMDEQTMVATQWPGRTMLATRRGALPLPPLRKDNPDAFLHQMRGVSFLVYDPNSSGMKGMNRQVAELSNRIRTEAMLPGGIILRLPDQRVENQGAGKR